MLFNKFRILLLHTAHFDKRIILPFESLQLLDFYFLYFFYTSNNKTTLFYLIPAVITQIFNPIVELAIPIGIPAKEAKAEIETHPIIIEITISECSI